MKMIVLFLVYPLSDETYKEYSNRLDSMSKLFSFNFKRQMNENLLINTYFMANHFFFFHFFDLPLNL